jgi:putative hydrolase of the HAD superfamily
VIRAVFWDIGGVLLSSPFDAFARFEEERGLPPGFLRQVNAADPHTNAWAHLERGDVSVDEFADLFEEECAALGHRVDAMEVLGLLTGEVRPQMVEAVRRCRERLKVGAITNNVAEERMSGSMAGILTLFDAVVESSKAGVRKPDPEIYALACAALAVEPHEAVFLDDLGINLKPARAMGMHTIKVVDPDVALKELEAAVGFPL